MTTLIPAKTLLVVDAGSGSHVIQLGTSNRQTRDAYETPVRLARYLLILGTACIEWGRFGSILLEVMIHEIR